MWFLLSGSNIFSIKKLSITFYFYNLFKMRSYIIAILLLHLYSESLDILLENFHAQPVYYRTTRMKSQVFFIVRAMWWDEDEKRACGRLDRPRIWRRPQDEYGGPSTRRKNINAARVRSTTHAGKIYNLYIYMERGLFAFVCACVCGPFWQHWLSGVRHKVESCFSGRKLGVYYGRGGVYDGQIIDSKHTHFL